MSASVCDGPSAAIEDRSISAARAAIAFDFPSASLQVHASL